MPVCHKDNQSYKITCLSTSGLRMMYLIANGSCWSYGGLIKINANEMQIVELS
jgi:hypothetical protein